MTKARAYRRIRSGILTARNADGMHVVAMIYGNGHDSLWMRAYTRSLPSRYRSREGRLPNGRDRQIITSWRARRQASTLETLPVRYGD